ncbi:MAG: DUF6390 family protein [Dehalococcoidia bacterium]
MSNDGPLLFARYAFKPNALGFCGGDDDRALFSYATENTIDPGLTQLEQQFEGAYPYLRLIAHANGLADPFDRRVVEAYWVGNELLDRIDMGLLHGSLEERFRARTTRPMWAWLASKVPAGARPHHSFHVFEVYPRAGMMKSGAVEHAFETMEQCRIRWGRVTDVLGPDLIVEVEPLRVVDGNLTLCPAERETVRRWVDGKGFVDDIQPGQWVSIHWGWACDRLSLAQRRRLERYTRWHITLCNQTL